jgi:hypothetical protein
MTLNRITTIKQHEYDGTRLFSDDGQPVQPSRHRTGPKSHDTTWTYIGPATVQNRKQAEFVDDILASTTVLQVARVDVVNDVEGTHYTVQVPIFPGSVFTEGPWFSVFASQALKNNTRFFTVRLTNWSADWGRWFRLHLEYTE